MNYHVMKSTAISLSAVMAFAIILTLPVNGAAQKSTPPPSQDRSKTYEPSRELRGREANITLMEHGKDETVRLEAIQKQMNEDFARIQALNADLAGAYALSGSPDYNRILEGSTEIKKRASRLKNNLMLPPGEKEDYEEKIGGERSQDKLQSSITILNDLIKSFISNPIFKKDREIDYKLVAKARRDLDGIIEFSGRVSKTSEKMIKASEKSN